MTEIAKLTQRYRAQDLERLADSDKRYELLRGTLIEMPPTKRMHGLLLLTFGARLLLHVTEHRLGQVVADVGFQLASDPDTVLAPDLAFISRERLPPLSAGYDALAPDLVIEIVSPGNTASALNEKIAAYFRAGVQRVWAIYPTTRLVYDYAALKQVTILDEGETLDGGAILPGFSIPVREIFAPLDFAAAEG
ncbi:MAG: Uma2 family endonuclease [Chloroflexi bacterium]|nr:Uma2 family endonuclease [Chloroflexota bacterium]